MTVHVRPESVFTLLRNMHQRLINEINSPNLLLDRIAPQPPKATICKIGLSHYDCRACVVTEPHGYMIVSGDATRPDTNLAMLGSAVLSRSRLDAYLNAKTSMLNAVHALLGGIWLHTRSCAKTLHNFLEESKTKHFVSCLLIEIEQSLDPIDGVDTSAYREAILARFDNDGTLVNSESIALNAAHRLVSDIMCRHGQKNPYTVAEFSQRFAGKNFSLILNELNDQLINGALTPSDIAQYTIEEDIRCCDALANAVTATPHSIETLQWIPTTQKAVITSATYKRCNASMRTVGIVDQFKGRIFSAVDSLPVPKPKPDPAIYNYAIKKLGLRQGKSWFRKNIVVVEDSGSGVASARQAGAEYVIGFVGADNLPTRSSREDQAEKLRLAGATDIIDDMALLPVVLAKRGFASDTRLLASYACSYAGGLVRTTQR